ncbi:MAG: peptide/nickel transport system substrate-binding protein, partial [Actinomycetota bacterium]|nr:peptide/nickel transport system substrate-binding protein [Actinomycetota bacterium]
MRDRRVLARLTILFVALSLVAAACGGGKSSSSSGSTTTSSQGKAVKGGTLVLGAEQEPDCADWIASCAGSSWGIWMFGAFTMPRVFGFDQASGVPKITPLVTSEPKLVDTNPGGMTVTYEISPKAVWSDGQPITSTDFKYTWTQIATGTEIYDKTGYEKITKIDDSNPKVAVVTFGEDYGGWHDLFGGFYGVYPSHLLAGKDRHAEMKDGYKWSGGPWMLDHWTKGQELKLVPNPKYWGAVPNLDAAVFKFVPQTSAEVEAYKSGQVAAIYPQAQLELEPLRTAPDTEFSVIDSLDYEALWFNVDKPPLNSLKVRQALAYATDRQAIVDALFKPVNPDIQPIQAFVTPANPKWYSDPFKIYTHDLKKVDELMTGDGWAKGS